MEVRSSCPMCCCGDQARRCGCPFNQGQVENDPVLQQGRMARLPEGRQKRRIRTSGVKIGPRLAVIRSNKRGRCFTALPLIIYILYMDKSKNKKILFIPGLGERAKDYKHLSKYMEIYNIDWNKIRLPRGKPDILIGFSMGAALACEYAEDHKVNTLILCSLTPNINTLKGLKAREVIFIIGEKEKWAYKNNRRLAKTLRCKWRIIVVPKADHKIVGNYRKKLLEVIKGHF